jgi:hypothetical protein
MYMQVNKE